MASSILTPKRVVVLGGQGSIAKLITTYFRAEHPAELLMPSRQDMPLPEGVRQLPKDVDILVNLAAVTRAKPANAAPAAALATNYLATVKLLEHYAGTNCRLVIASTVKSVTFDSMYSWSKAAAEAAVASSSDVQVAAVRFGNIIEQSPSISAILNSIRSKSPAFVAAAREYYQHALSAFATLKFALEAPPASIVTPLMSYIPVTFIAGFLAGAMTEPGPDSEWHPKYSGVGAEHVPLLPSWWTPFTKVRGSDVSTEPKYLVTNFQGEMNAESYSKDLSQLVAEAEEPKFGWLVQTLKESLARQERPD